MGEPARDYTLTPYRRIIELTDNSIPAIDAATLFNPTKPEYQSTLSAVHYAATQVGFMTVYNTGISRSQVEDLLAKYRQFFLLPNEIKATVDMAKTHSNRGWGASGAEQVSATANPDYKQVFDCGPELAANDPLSELTYYAPNLWPVQPEQFRETVVNYYQQAVAVAHEMLSAIAASLNKDARYFNTAFDKPMVLLRGNYYPERPTDATERDAGIAEHTDYGCLTLLATDGTPGLEVKMHDGSWHSISVPPGEFIVNFGEMLESWTDGTVKATPHRVIGGNHERVSAPLFFNPRHDVNVAPAESGLSILAGDHLGKRYDETYLHRKSAHRAGER